jgi:hypothetical protein
MTRLNFATRSSRQRRLATRALCAVALTSVALSGTACMGPGAFWGGGSSGGYDPQTTPACGAGLTGPALQESIDRSDCRYLPRWRRS